MRLIVTTPTHLIVDSDDVEHVRAEDETGMFGIHPGHADFLTVLSVCVVSWQDETGNAHHVAVRGGVLTVRDGRRVEIASRDAVGEATLERLGSAVLERFRADEATESESRISSTRLHLATIRQLQRFAQSAHRQIPAGNPPDLVTRSQTDELSGESSL
jgi:F-type H+-transporting ATPase subunit epsilon